VLAKQDRLPVLKLSPVAYTQDGHLRNPISGFEY
jgi:hypothetical protein